MRKIGFFMLVWLVVAAAAAGAEELRVYTWSEYMDEEKMPADFEKKYGIKVRLDIYENNEEMVAKLQAGGASQYDIIVPSDYIMPVLIQVNPLPTEFPPPPSTCQAATGRHSATARCPRGRSSA